MVTAGSDSTCSENCKLKLVPAIEKIGVDETCDIPSPKSVQLANSPEFGVAIAVLERKYRMFPS